MRACAMICLCIQEAGLPLLENLSISSGQPTTQGLLEAQKTEDRYALAAPTASELSLSLVTAAPPNMMVAAEAVAQRNPYTDTSEEL